MRRKEIQIKLQDNFEQPENQVEILKTLEVMKKWLLTPDAEKTGLRSLVFRIAELTRQLTKTKKYVDIAHEYRVEYNAGLGYSELLIEDKEEGIFDRGTGINVIAFGKAQYYQDLIELYIKYEFQDAGASITGAGIVNNQNGQVLLSQISQGETTNKLYFMEACNIIKKHTAYDPEVLPGYMA